MREFKHQAAPGETYVNAFSDGGSTPPASTTGEPDEHVRILMLEGVFVLVCPI